MPILQKSEQALLKSQRAISRRNKTVLEEVSQLICGDREETYGAPGKNLRYIAEQWQLYLEQKYERDFTISAEDVCYMMADLKKCRQLHKAKRDNVVDGIGYLALIERL